MALGNYNSNKNDKKAYSPTVYSAYSFGNSESEVDATLLTTKFWNNMLVFTISPRLATNDDTVKYDTDNAISIYLSHSKAYLLYQEICKFQEDPDLYGNLGVNSGAGLISISNGKEYGINCPCIIIRKIDSENGVCVSSYCYQIKQAYHYSIRNFEKTGSFDKVYYDNLELEQLKTLLKTYYVAMSGAAAYSVIENSKYDNSRLNTKIESIGEKVGVDFGKKNGGSGSKPSTSFFNKEPRNFSSSSIDDIASQIG